jgi:hypothetical protein
MCVASKMWLVSMRVAVLKAGDLKMLGNDPRCRNWKVYGKRIECVYFLGVLVHYLHRLLQRNRTAPGHFWICFSSHVLVILLRKMFRVLWSVPVARGGVAMLVAPTTVLAALFAHHPLELVSIHPSKYGPCRGYLHLRHVLSPCSFSARPREYQVCLPEYLYLIGFEGDLVEPGLVRRVVPPDLCAASKMPLYLTPCSDLDLENCGVIFEGLSYMAGHSRSDLYMSTPDSSNLCEEVVTLVYGG